MGGAMKLARLFRIKGRCTATGRYLAFALMSCLVFNTSIGCAYWKTVEVRFDEKLGKTVYSPLIKEGDVIRITDADSNSNVYTAHPQMDLSGARKIEVKRGGLGGFGSFLGILLGGAVIVLVGGVLLLYWIGWRIAESHRNT
jgi:hypothetical protein